MRAVVLRAFPSAVWAGPDGRRHVRLRAFFDDGGPPSEGDHVELDGDPVRWYCVVSSCPVLARARGLLAELVLRASSPEERLAWEVMSS